MRKYFYQTETTQSEQYEEGERRFHLYVMAKPRFSLREVLAKQDWVMYHLLELPFHKVELKIGASRESRTLKILVDKQEVESLLPLVSAFRYTYISLDKVSHYMETYYENVLEFVFTKEEDVNPFLEWIKEKWRGEWVEDNE